MNLQTFTLAAFTLILAQPLQAQSPYERDAIDARIAYAEEHTETASNEDTNVVFKTLPKKHDILILIGRGWSKEVVDSYLYNSYRRGNMRKLGFKGMAFYENKIGKNGKEKLVCYGSFTFKN